MPPLAKEHKYQNANNPDFLKELENETKNRSFINNIPGADQGGSG